MKWGSRPRGRQVAAVAALAGLLLFGCGKKSAVPVQSAAPEQSPVPAQREGFVPARAEVYFSPDGGCTDAVVREIAAARKEIKVQAYSFTSPPIASALRDAFRRGVKVTALLDKSNDTERYTEATFLSNAGVPTYIDDRHAIAHNKIMILDDATVITGSFNFTRAAEDRNAENLLIIKDSPDLVRAYDANFSAHLEHSSPYHRAAGEVPERPRRRRRTRE